jgi:hypothetical protein
MLLNKFFTLDDETGVFRQASVHVNCRGSQARVTLCVSLTADWKLPTGD